MFGAFRIYHLACHAVAWKAKAGLPRRSNMPPCTGFRIIELLRHKLRFEELAQRRRAAMGCAIVGVLILGTLSRRSPIAA